MSVSIDMELNDLKSHLLEYEEQEKIEKVKKKKRKRLLAFWDIETDPFKFGRVPQPFCCGLTIIHDDGSRSYKDFWGDDCLEEFYIWVTNLETPLKIFAHNGGKFDFIYLMKLGLLEGIPRIINGRIVEAKLEQHVVRDSYAMIPVALGSYEKVEIDYEKFERENREKHKGEILHYLKMDCEYLADLVENFIGRFGDHLTIGSLSVKTLMKIHPFERITKGQDALIRPYYFGGRVQCFETGVLEGKFKVLDVNSMYPYVMAEKKHPLGESGFSVSGSNFYNYINFDDFSAKNGNPYFLTFKGKNHGCLPSRKKDGSLDFTVEEGVFKACSHEIILGLKLGILEIEQPLEAVFFEECISFKEFVDTYIQDKIDAKKSGDKLKELFSKLLLNSSYGKTAQNPTNYYDWKIVDAGDYDKIRAENRANIELWENEKELRFSDFSNLREIEEAGIEPPHVWELAHQYGDVADIFKRPLEDHKYFDVAIGASITSAARCVLLEAIHKAKRPLYCDTDSIICEDLKGVDLHPSRLGAWDNEGEGDKLAIYGKKVYALFNGEKGTKKACKGVDLDHKQILNLANGGSETSQKESPTFSLSGTSVFVTRILNAEKHSKLYDEDMKKLIEENRAILEAEKTAKKLNFFDDKNLHENGSSI